MISSENWFLHDRTFFLVLLPYVVGLFNASPTVCHALVPFLAHATLFQGFLQLSIGVSWNLRLLDPQVHALQVFYTPSNNRFSLRFSLGHKLSSINEGSSSQKSFVDSFTLSSRKQSSDKCSSSYTSFFACSLTRTNKTEIPEHRVSKSSNRLLSFSKWATDDVCLIFLSLLCSRICIRNIKLLSSRPCTNSTLSASCMTQPTWLSISRKRAAVLFAGFNQIILSESQRSSETFLLFRFLSEPLSGVFKRNSLLLEVFPYNNPYMKLFL